MPGVDEKTVGFLWVPLSEHRLYVQAVQADVGHACLVTCQNI